jgi:hypothetical protein
MHCKLVPPFDFGSPLGPPFGRLSQWSVSLGSLWCSIIFQFSRDTLRQNETNQAAVLTRSKLLIDRHCQ